MPIVADPRAVRELYAQAAERRWVLPCFCTENLTTTEAVLSAADEFARACGIDGLPVTLAMTCRYSHRPQAVNYTHTRRWDTGLRLFMADLAVLAGPGGPFERLRVMAHLDHIQHDDDGELLGWDLSPYSSVMYDASALPLEQNMEKTARFVEKAGRAILIEGACDEIADAGGQAVNALTTPEKAERYLRATGADLVVANLGTEHRAGAKNLKYESAAACAIRDRIGHRIVLHGTSSVPNGQVANLFADGVCKVNIWTALERDSSPALFEDMVRNAGKVAGTDTVNRLVNEGWLGEKCRGADGAALSHFTTLYRQGLVFEAMKGMVGEYLGMWYV